MHSTKVIPVRFLSLIAHLVILITILWSRRSNVLACLPLQYTSSQFDEKDQQLTIGLSVGISLIGIELASFLFGVSMFSPATSMFSTVAHASAAISLSLFVLNSWDCDVYWYIFGVCSGLPTLCEFVVIIRYFQSRPRVT